MEDFGGPSAKLWRFPSTIKCKTRKIMSNPKFESNSFQINGARLFNCLPKKLRDFRFYQEDFKLELDKYLSSVPDQPRVGGLIPEAVCQVTCKQSNSLIAWTHDT